MCGSSMAGPAMSAYRSRLEATGIDLGPSWDVAMTAALGAWVLAWGSEIAKLLDKDSEWGTTTMRPRLFRCLTSGSRKCERRQELPGACRDRITAILADRGQWPGSYLKESWSLVR
jgi:hypothetical protein